jgi:NDP-sugar pyrophosphorylase family protein
MSFLEQILCDCRILINETSIKENIVIPEPNFQSFPELLTYLELLEKLYPNLQSYGLENKRAENTLIEGLIITGDNVEIHPFTHIRGPVIINSFSKVKGEIKKSYIGKRTNSSHMSNYIGDSIIGNNCNLGAGTKTANLRFDNNEVILRIGDKKVKTNRNKFGCVMENGVKTCTNYSILPGSYIHENSRLIN